MIKCWLCRESFEPGLPMRHGFECPSCLVEVGEDGTMRTEPGTVNVTIALARATDRLTKQLADDVERQRKNDIAEKLGIK